MGFQVKDRNGMIGYKEQNIIAQVITNILFYGNIIHNCIGGIKIVCSVMFPVMGDLFQASFHLMLIFPLREICKWSKPGQTWPGKGSIGEEDITFAFEYTSYPAHMCNMYCITYTYTCKDLGQ